MIDNQNILMCGPVAPPVHGQSLSFTLITENYSCNKKYIVNHNFKNRKIYERVLTTVTVVLKCFFYLLTKKIDLIYFSSSRSVGGCIKDICLINLASLFKIKLINHVHGADFENLILNKPKVFTKIIEFSYNKVAISIVLLESMKEPFRRFKTMQLKVLPNFYDPSLDEYSCTTSMSAIEVLYLSNIMKTKGILELIDAFALYSTKNPNVKLNIVGGFVGDYECSAQEIENLFYEKIKDTDNITYHGILNGKEKCEILYRSSIFVLPTYHVSEAFPISIIEAMRAGCGIITTRHNSLPDIINSSNGILIDMHDVQQLAVAMDFLSKNTTLLNKIKHTNITEAKRKYSLDANLQQLNQIFTEELRNIKNNKH